MCVFCGSADGKFSEYRAEAESLGQLAGRNDITGIWGAGMKGLMGAFARGCLDAGGKMIGVTTPAIQAIELPLPESDHMVVIAEKDMPDRKRTMIEGADAIIILPGGIGTLDESAEALTLDQLRMITGKPIIFINVLGFYDHLFAFFNRVDGDGFLRFPIHYQVFDDSHSAMRSLMGQLLWETPRVTQSNVVPIRA